MIFGHTAKDFQPTVHTTRGARKQGGPQEKNTWSPREGKGDRNL